MAIDKATLGTTNFPVRIERAIFPTSAGEVVTDVARIDQRKCDEEAIARLCGNAGSIRRAMARRNAPAILAKGLDSAVYVAASKANRAAKIGMTRNPAARMATLQAGSYEELNFTHLFWMGHRAAFGVEALALRVATKLGKRLVGEWIDADSDGAAMIVACLLKASQISFSDSAMFCQNFDSAFSQTDIHATTGGMRVRPEETILARMDNEALDVSVDLEHSD